MKTTCPVCDARADLTVAVVVVDPDFSSEDSDWKLTCGCGLDVEGRFGLVHRAVATLLFLAPIAVAWAVFLVSGYESSSPWLDLLVFLLYLLGGFLVGSLLSTRYGLSVIRRTAHPGRRSRPGEGARGGSRPARGEGSVGNDGETA